MKDLVQIWNKVTGRRYSSVNTSDRELADISNHSPQSDLNLSSFQQNVSECEGVDTKFDDINFNDRRDAIINSMFERRKRGRVARQPKCLFILLMLGFFGLGAGFFILFVHPYNFFFAQKVMLTDGGEIFEMWRKPEVELYVKIFLFNVTNAEEYMSGVDKKLKLQEVGPYVYREGIEHIITKFNDNGTLSAVPKHPLTWVDELSEGNKEDDMVYLPHIALLSIANVVSKQSFFTRLGLNNVVRLTNSQPLAKMTAREFMMGYESRLMTLGNTFLPGWIYFDKLGLIDRMYDFDGDFETIFTGETDIRHSGLIDTYRGSVDLPQWKGSHCSNIQYASDGTKFQGGISMNDTVKFYRKSLCRPAPLTPTGEGMKSGLNAYKLSLPEHLLDNGKFNEENKCFCREGKCLPEGLIDVTDCYYGFPIALSYPHFYKGDPVLFSKVEGLKPNKDRHETRFWVEPESGLPLDVSAKFQINMALGDITQIANTEKFANMYLPLLWFDIRMYSLPMTMEQRFNLYLNILPKVEKSAMYILFIVGTVLILMSVYRLTFKIMFKTLENKKHNNLVIGSKHWVEREKNNRNRKNDIDGIYSACEIPLNDTESDSSDSQIDERRKSLLKSHSEKIKELGTLLGDKVYDTAGNVKDKVKEEITNVRSMFGNEKRDSLITTDVGVNEAFKSDSSDSEREYKGTYQSIRQTDSDDDFKYLEVLDDGSEFDEPTNREKLYPKINLKGIDDIV